MLATDLSRALDPVLFAKDCGINPDRWQADLLRKQPKRCLLLAARQSGKSTVTALLALWTAIYQSGALILLLSPSQRQSGELFRKVIEGHARLNGAPPLQAQSALRAELSNGSRIVALPGNERTTRGYSGVDLLIIDESARVDDALITAIRPMLATKAEGRLLQLTTPAGKRGQFFDAWTKGGSDYHRIRIPASECPRISPEFLQEELRELGPQRFAAEYELEFLDDDAAVFPVAVINAAFSSTVQPLWA